MEFLVVLFAALALFFYFKSRKSEKKRKEESEAQARSHAEKAEYLERRISALAKYEPILDVEAKARQLEEEANQKWEDAKVSTEKLINEAKQQAEQIAFEAKTKAKEVVAGAQAKAQQSELEANRKREDAKVSAEKLLNEAKQQAEQIAGDAYAAQGRAKEFSEIVRAMKNIIEGYGDAYIVPSYQLLDDLAEEFGFTEAGQKLKEARENSRRLVKSGLAATCDYVESNRKETAIRFVVDAFNGKVDSLLSRSKSDNHGKLEQEIRDAFALVNHNGSAFRNARISELYLSARLDELKWAASAHALKEREREEQRQLREQMREEEKARREYERAVKEAAKEEETIRKTMEKMQQQAAMASEAQRAEYEEKLRELEAKLLHAEEKNQRALSMAQQTRTGHVYVISNIGSFGEDVFKIGMTRRLEPKDRVRELGDASVPFEFDIHAMIFSEDAPTLENTLHQNFLRKQVNKVNPRKEFFRTNLGDIRKEIEELGVAAHWTMTAEAVQFRETQRLEQQMLENPEMEKEWLSQQLKKERVVRVIEEEEA